MLDGTTIFLLIRLSVLSLLLWLLYGVLRSCFFVIRGQEQRAKYLGTQLIIFAIAFILLWPATGFRLQQRYMERRYRPQLYKIAEQLGYTPADLLLEDSGCWDTGITIPPFITQRCEIFLHFTTDLNATALAPLVAKLPADRISERAGSDTLSQQITRLAIETPTAEPHNAVKGDTEVQIYRYTWSFSDNDKIFQQIELYETSTVRGLAFKGKPITKNIVRVDVAIGDPSLY